MHKAGKKRGEAELPPPEEDTLQPVSKESTVLSFSWVMMREEESIVGPEGEEEATSGIEEDICQDENEENEKGGDLLVIQMTKTSISVVSGRGCDVGSPCTGCHGTRCTFNDIIVVAESSTVTVGE